MKIDAECKRKLRELGATELLAAAEAQDDAVCMGMSCGERLQMMVDEAHSAWLTGKVEGLTRKARLKYPDADVRKVDFSDDRGLDRVKLAELATCRFAEDGDNIIFQGFTGSGKTYLSNAIAKEACRHRMSVLYTRMPSLHEKWKGACLKPGSEQRLIGKLARCQVLVLDEWLLNKMDKDFRSMILEVMEERCGTRSTIFCTQFKQSDWHANLGGGIQADAIMDRIVHGAIWVETGEVNMRAKLAAKKK